MQMLQAMPTAVEGYYLVSDKELQELREKSATLDRELLQGRIWTYKDIRPRVNNRAWNWFRDHVIIPRKDDLRQCGALIKESTGQGSSYEFLASKMSVWLENNMTRIAQGGWD